MAKLVYLFASQLVQQASEDVMLTVGLFGYVVVPLVLSLFMAMCYVMKKSFARKVLSILLVLSYVITSFIMYDTIKVLLVIVVIAVVAVCGYRLEMGTWRFNLKK